MSGERMDDDKIITPADLIEATGLDVRGVWVVWTDKEDDDSWPVPDYFGCSAFEALGMAHALVDYLERVCRLRDEDEDDDDGGDDGEPDDGPPPDYDPGDAKPLPGRELVDAA